MSVCLSFPFLFGVSSTTSIVCAHPYSRYISWFGQFSKITILLRCVDNNNEYSALKWAQRMITVFSLSLSLSVSPDNSPATTHTRTCSPTSMERGTQEYVCSESVELFGKGMNYNKEANEGKNPRAWMAYDVVVKWTKELFFGELAPDGDGVILCLQYFTPEHQHIWKCVPNVVASRSLCSLVHCSGSCCGPLALSLSPCVWRVLNRWRRANAPYGIHCGRIEIRVTLSVSIWIWPEEDVEFYASRYSFSQVYKYHTFIIFTLSQCERKVFGKKKEIVKIFAHHQYFLFTLLVCGCFAIIFFFSICVFGKFTWNGFPQNILNSIEPNKIVCFTHFSWHISELWNKRN